MANGLCNGTADIAVSKYLVEGSTLAESRSPIKNVEFQNLCPTYRGFSFGFDFLRFTKNKNSKILKFENFIFSNLQKSGLNFYLAFDKSILSLYPHTRSSPAHLLDNFKRVYIPFLGN